jgi:predicted flap endonuclease-1-like 5' DNA nuclease
MTLYKKKGVLMAKKIGQTPPWPPPSGRGGSIIKIEGIGEAYAAKIRQVGVRTTTALLQKGSTPKGRLELAKATGTSTKLILEWVNRADLFRVKGVGVQYSDLLEAVGVDTVPELAQRKPKALLDAIVKVNLQKNLVNQLPGLSRVETWVNHAKTLEKIVKY